MRHEQTSIRFKNPAIFSQNSQGIIEFQSAPVKAKKLIATFSLPLRLKCAKIITSLITLAL
ncbi:MAG: hypothetical protein B6240_11610 [Desulfobacteraceae bacterium 4572_87]|nr:MAG: hypothetical protein B6240_11610 [Desulfobacteraceae bacterium 4572_87]